jgi:hypothetical protein
MAPAAYLVAMCDVLGFTNLVASATLDEIRRRYLALVAHLGPHPLFRIRTASHEREVVLNRVVFSDTVLFWAPDGDAMELLPHVVAQILGRAMDSMPLRVGFAFGDCIIDPANELYIGQPIIDAYHTEQAQDWVGGAFHPTCWLRPGLRDRLCRGYEGSAVEYAVPVKAGPPTGGVRLDYALNWPALVGPDFSVEALTALEAGAAAPARAKWRNARRFYDAVLAHRDEASRP